MTSRRLLAVPWHPLLFAATVVMASWLDTVVSPQAALRSLVVASVGAASLTMIVWGLLRNGPRAGIVVSGLIGLLYSKHLVEMVSAWQWAMPMWLIIVWSLAIGGALALAVRLLRKSSVTFSAPGANRLLNWAGLIYIGSTIGLALVSGKLAYALGDLDQGVPLSATQQAVDTHDASSSPDVYLVLLDGYPRADVLKEAFGIDNRPFVRDLEERGFDVATESRSDYLWTQQSLTSMLHMSFVEDLPRFQAILDGWEPKDPSLRELVNDNPVFDLARDHGYEVVATGYEFDQVALRKADVYVDSGHMNDFELNLLVSTYLGDVLAVLTPDLASGQHRYRIEHQLDSLGAIAAARAEGPRLVLGHVAAPHQPTVFGRHGEPVVEPISRHFYADSPQEQNEPMAEFVNKYRAQLAYLNTRVLQAVDAILANAERPPVVILWADHGSSSRVDWNVTAPAEADPAALRERTATLFAALTPDRTSVFPNDVTPASIFRFLADAYFGTDYGPAVRSADADPAPADLLAPDDG